MVWWGVLLIEIGSVLALILAGFWLAFALFIASFIGFLFVPNTHVAFSLISAAINNGLTSYSLTAGALFIFMGQILLCSGIAPKAYMAVDRIFGGMRGSALYANLVGCGIFSAVTGSSLATASAMSSVGAPELRRRGYNIDVGLASLAAGGTLGTLLPPSVLLIIFGAITGTNVAELFVAGIIPGVLTLVCFCIYIWIRLKVNPDLAGSERATSVDSTNSLAIDPSHSDGEKREFAGGALTSGGDIVMVSADPLPEGGATSSQDEPADDEIFEFLALTGQESRGGGSLTDALRMWTAVGYLLPLFGLIALVLGSIYSGLATPTDAGGVGAVLAFVIGGTVGKLSFASVKLAIRRTVAVVGMIGAIIIAASSFQSILVSSGATNGLVTWVVGLGLNRWELLLAVAIVYLFLGGLVDSLSLIYITIPILLPVFAAFNLNLIWVAVLIAIHVEIGQITPPVGLNLFMVHTIAPESSYIRLVRAAIPYATIMFAVSVVVYFIPNMALWLPGHVGQ